MKKVCILFVIIGLIITESKAQNTMYYMDRLPQIQQYNPALIPKVKSYFGLPGIGTEQVEINNSGFNLGQFLDFQNSIGEANYNPDEFINSVGGINKTKLETRSNLLALGFQPGKQDYLSMGLSIRNFADMVAPSKILYLTEDFESIADRLPLSINEINVQTNTFSQFSVTYARTFWEKVNIGISPKLVGALGGINTKKLDLEISQNDDYENNSEYEDEYIADYSGEVQIGLPMAINPDAIGDNGELIPEEDILDPDWVKNTLKNPLFKNTSLLFDIGVQYQLNSSWSFSASILDIGKTSWKKYAYEIYFNDQDESAYVKELSAFKVKVPSKLYIGSSYNINPNWSAGFLFRDVMYDSQSYASATISLNGYIGSMLSTSVSYTYGYSFDNLGLGLRLRFFPGMDLYMVTDNILQAFNYKKVQYTTVALGMNISFGVRKKHFKTEQEESLQ
ncbi:MAG: DUF5723 family protein [Draconibacterium sp.]